MKQALSESLPDYDGKAETVEDIYLLSDMLTCLFDCRSVGLRLAPLKKSMCPSFHMDNIPVRLVNTYLGSGTEWLPLENVYQTPPRNNRSTYAKTNYGSYYDPNQIKTMKAFDVGLLKGKAWQDQEDMAAVHRSCQVRENEKRVLLTLDPM